MYERFSSFLRELAPYVVVVGSYGRGTERDTSDIDCYLRMRPPIEVDLETGADNETYMPEILDLIKQYGYISDSVIVGHISVERQPGVPRMVEISSHYRIRHNTAVSVREIYGVPFLCAADNKNCPHSELYESVDWSDEVGDVVMSYPLPVYSEMVPLSAAQIIAGQKGQSNG